MLCLFDIPTGHPLFWRLILISRENGAPVQPHATGTPLETNEQRDGPTGDFARHQHEHAVLRMTPSSVSSMPSSASKSSLSILALHGKVYQDCYTADQNLAKALCLSESPFGGTHTCLGFHVDRMQIQDITRSFQRPHSKHAGGELLHHLGTRLVR